MLVIVFTFIFLISINFINCGQHPHFKTSPAVNQEEVEPSYWRESAQNVLQQKLKETENSNLAKNVIFFMGDGMDMTTVNAARVYMHGGEEKALFFENFPHFGLSVTYCVDRKVPDSACAATALLTGVKGNYATVGLNADTERFDCNGYANSVSHTESILRWAQLAGKSTGIVTNTRVTHASPAGAYAHSADRGWEADSFVTEAGCDLKLSPDIAEQLIYSSTGQEFKVILGGGRRMLLDQSFKDEEGQNGTRTDGRNYIQEWKNLKGIQKKSFNYVWNKSQLQNIDFNQTDYLLGLFESDHCHYNLDIKNQNLANEPTLTEMVEAAVKMLETDPNGYFLFVEGGKIDMGHHGTWAQHAMEETAEFTRAIEKVYTMSDPENTLIVVTADHGHAVMYNGYAQRGHNILGLAQKSYEDLLPWTTISYANGRGYYETYNENGGRKSWNEEDMKDPYTWYMATAPIGSETHSGGHVGVWATGPHSHLFVGTYEESSIPFLIAYAAKLGPYSTGKGSSRKASLTLMSIVILLVKLFNFISK